MFRTAKDLQALTAHHCYLYCFTASKSFPAATHFQNKIRNHHKKKRTMLYALLYRSQKHVTAQTT